jgi:hypothetical protein
MIEMEAAFNAIAPSPAHSMRLADAIPGSMCPIDGKQR